MNASIISQSNSDWQTFKFGNIEVRGKLDDNGEPIFNADDVCKALGIVNTSQAVARLDTDEYSTICSTYNGLTVRNLVVNESGLYSLVSGSRKPEAKTFKRWINHDVLPTLRKQHFYADNSLSSLDIVERMVGVLRDREKHDAIQDQRLDLLENRVDEKDWQTIAHYIAVQGLKIPRTFYNGLGRKAAALSRERGIQIRKAEPKPGQSWSDNAYHVSILAEVCSMPPKAIGQLPMDGLE